MKLVGSQHTPEDAACWVCCDGGDSGELLSMGCACRGSGGWAHVDCLVQLATCDVERWVSCQTCRQDFTGDMEVALARARWCRVQDRPEDDAERLFVANNLAVTLQESAGDYEGSLRLLEEVLEVRRRMLGDDHPDTLDSITNLALHHTETGSYEVALKLSEEVVAATRRTMGDEPAGEEAAHSIGSLAAVHNLMGNCQLAEPLHREALQIREQLLGSEHVDTLNSTYGLAHSILGLGRHAEALGMLERVASAANKLLGAAHPTAQHFANGLQKAQAKVSAAQRDYSSVRK